jgi:hypothetical protein
MCVAGSLNDEPRQSGRGDLQKVPNRHLAGRFFANLVLCVRLATNHPGAA